MRKRERNVALGTLIAAGIGYVTGILTAPKSGRETRTEIKKAALQAKKEAEEKLKDLHTEISGLIDQGKKLADSVKGSSKEGFSEALDKAQQAKEKARNLLSALHEGDSDDKDLQKAIKEVDKAIEHLRKYLKKDAKKT